MCTVWLADRRGGGAVDAPNVTGMGALPALPVRFAVDRGRRSGVPADELDQGPGGEAGRPGRHLVVRPVAARRTGDVQVRPWQAGGELAQEQRSPDASRP